MSYVVSKGDRVNTPHGMGTVSGLSQSPNGGIEVYVRMDQIGMKANFRGEISYAEEFVQPTTSTEIIHARRIQRR